MMATPLEITIAIHYYTRPERYAWRDPSHADSPGVREIKDKFTRMGLITPVAQPAGCHESTADYFPVDEALRPYIEALRAVNFPTRQWVVVNAPLDNPVTAAD